MLYEFSGVWQTGGSTHNVPYSAVVIPAGVTPTIVVRVTRTDRRPCELNKLFVYLRLFDRINNRLVKEVQGVFNLQNEAVFEVSPPSNSVGQSYLWNVATDPLSTGNETIVIASSLWRYV